MKPHDETMVYKSRKSVNERGSKLCFIGTDPQDSLSKYSFDPCVHTEGDNGLDQIAFKPPEDVREVPKSDEFVLYENPQTGETFHVAETSVSVAPESTNQDLDGPYRTVTIPRRVLADYDSDDERIINLKEQGCSDEMVLEKVNLKDQDKHTLKSIGNRWPRLRKALEQCEEERLDDELFDWHIREDEELYASVQLALLKHQEEVQKLEEKKWKLVATHLADRIGEKKYTAKACRERYEAILTGLALLPIELDADQEGRRCLREQRMKGAKSIRARLDADAEDAFTIKKRAEAARKRYKEEMDLERCEESEKKAKEKETNARVKLDKQVGRKRAVNASHAFRAQSRAFTLWKKQVEEAENAVYFQLTGRPLDRKRKTIIACRAARKKERPKFLVSDGEADDMSMDLDEPTERDDIMNHNNAEQSTENDVAVEQNQKKKKSSKEFGPPIPPGRAKVTAETLASPRSIMTLAELDVLIIKRGMPRRTPKETHPQLVARLHWTDNLSTTKGLSTLLREYFDKGKGSKLSKAGRLALADAQSSAAGQAGITSTDSDFVRVYHGYTEMFQPNSSDLPMEMLGVTGRPD